MSPHYIAIAFPSKIHKGNMQEMLIVNSTNFCCLLVLASSSLISGIFIHE